MFPHSKFYQNQNSKRSSALIITLVVLVLVTLLVVSLTSMIGLERTSTHESFENQRAREVASLAVDEVVALLRDNIPSNNIWAVAPGRLVAYTSQTAYTNIALCSGQAQGAAKSTGQVDLNAPVLGAGITSYPIIPTNSEYPSQTPMPMGWIEVVLNTNTGSVFLIRPDPNGSQNSNVARTNVVLGRYAYWVDTESSKVNVNTAGQGKATYSFNGTNYVSAGNTNNDLQNLTGAPSRVDLSQLDGGITPAQSRATYHYTYGGNWLPYGTNDSLGAPVYEGNGVSGVPPSGPYPAVPTNGPGGSSQGMKRFATIQQWSQMTNDWISGSSVTPITAAQVEQNKFYLTTRSWSPDVTPWGFNKMWLQSTPVNPCIWILNGPGTQWSALYGNKLNGKGVPIYPVSYGLAQSNSAPSTGSTKGGASFCGDNRYYATPFIYPTKVGSVLNNPDFQFAGQYDGSNTRTQAFLNAMMVQLNRTDWPGFSGQSFVGKYGQAECEDLAFNMLSLYDSAIHSNGENLQIYATGAPTNSAVDPYGIYGSCAQYTVDGKTRLFSGVGEWPYLNQISVQIVPVGNKGPSTATTSATASRYSGIITNSYGTSPVTTVTDWTKVQGSVGGGSIGFVPKWTANATPSLTPVNVGILPSAQIIYPPGFKNPYVTGGGAYLCDIEAYATGVFHGTNVTYGTTNSVDPEPLPANNTTYHPYYWGVLDCYKSNWVVNPNAPPPMIAQINDDQGVGPANFMSVVPATAMSATGNSPVGNFVGTYTYNFPTVYMGPFDQNSVISDVQFRCRFVLHCENIRTADVPTEIAPLAYNACNVASAANQNMCFTNVMSGVAPTFHFGMNDLGSVNALLTSDLASSVYVAYDLDDPRVYRYLSDWTERIGTTQSAGGIKTGNRPGYQSSYTDGLTGIKGDDSKFAWPDIGAGYFNTGVTYYTNIAGYAGDIRLQQNANNIEGFPGIGWLSVLPLNCESSQGLVSLGTGSGDPNNPGKPIPWRTLSLEPTPASNNLQSGGKLPDWMLLQAFAVAYDQTFCSQTEGKININAAISPQFPSGTTIAARTKPLQALIAPASYPSSSTVDLPALNAATIAADIAKGPASPNYTTPYGSSLPSDILMYPGQLCQFSTMAGTGGGANTQWQRESLMRNIAGIVTTQSSDFKVHVVAQAVKQVAYTGDPTVDFQITGEQRLSAVVSRVTNLGPDNLPDTGDEPVNPTLDTVASSTPTSVTPNSGINTTLTNGTPSFKYQISNVSYINN